MNSVSGDCVNFLIIGVNINFQRKILYDDQSYFIRNSFIAIELIDLICNFKSFERYHTNEKKIIDRKSFDIMDAVFNESNM